MCGHSEEESLRAYSQSSKKKQLTRTWCCECTIRSDAEGLHRYLAKGLHSAKSNSLKPMAHMYVDCESLETYPKLSRGCSYRWSTQLSTAKDGSSEVGEDTCHCTCCCASICMAKPSHSNLARLSPRRARADRVAPPALAWWSPARSSAPADVVRQRR